MPELTIWEKRNKKFERKGMFLDCSKFASLGYFGPFLTATLGVLSLAGILKHLMYGKKVEWKD